ncbi:tetratricopeptide repeat protein [Lentisphaera profundi]|uniref:Tetratricopeptide repeat protein n=1 Tax=Lentisphaera profundi TaxID=1658616 RepID=A0ABY7VNF5_9BACT|nr:tetratricopeptide repeat protein [Lentisphaera profundi]WDE95646.1 tetratricopeptide repeat protein [Lentisphaera profundi]
MFTSFRIILMVLFLSNLSVYAQTARNLDLTPIDEVKTQDPIVDDEVKKDEREKVQEKRLEKLEKAAEAGSKTAILELGNNYFYGRLGLEKDTAMAAQWWRRGADKNHRQCMYNLANLYIRGDGVEKSEDEGLKYYMKAADFGLVQANINAALLLDRREDYKKAIRYFQEASLIKDYRAISRLAEYYERGLGGPKRVLDAIALYRESAQKGNADAQLKMAEFSNNQEYPSVYNRKEALKWLMLSADNGNSTSEARVAYCYQNGIGVRKDNEVAIRWFLRAANKNYPPAQVALGNCYSVGSGVSANLEIAYTWYEKAARLGNSSGLYNAGVCHIRGIGTKVNVARGLDYYQRAAEQNYAQAIYVLAYMYETGEDVKKDINKAIIYYQKAALQNHADALYELGRIYLAGEYLKANRDQAEIMLKKSAEMGNRDAFVLYQKSFVQKN